MSKFTDAKSSAIGASRAAGGSHQTIEARECTLRRLVEHCYEKGFQITGMDGIRGKHIASFVEAQKEISSPRTVMNQLSHIRSGLEAVGKGSLASHESISNKAFGLDGQSRKGTNQAATPEQYQAALAVAGARDAGVAACLRLEATLGLRGSEAVGAGPSLRAWEKALTTPGQACRVISETKGGRDRFVVPPDREAALAAVRGAIEHLKANGREHMLPGERQQAIDRYYNEMRVVRAETGVTGHSLRYTFAQASVDRYRAEGAGDKEAYAVTSVDLGHGDGRGTWVKQVYDQRGGEG